MAVLSVTVDVDNDVFTEFLPVSKRKLGYHRNCQRIVSINVEDGSLHDLGNVRAIETGARVGWIRRESNLVIDHYVNRSSCPVAWKFGKIEDFRDHSLTCHCRISMDKNGKYPLAVAISAQTLASSGFPLDHSVDGLEVAGVRRKMDHHLLSAGSGSNRFVAQVVLYVATAMGSIGNEVFRKLTEDEFG